MKDLNLIQVENRKRGMDLLDRVMSRLRNEMETQEPKGKIADGLSFADDEIKKTYETCQELKLRLSLMSEDVRVVTTSPHLGPITETNGGVIYSKGKDCLNIQIPQATNANHENQILFGLFKAFQSSELDLDWAVDFSDIKHIPLNTLVTLYAYRCALRDKGRELKLAWVNSAALENVSKNRAIELFDLVKKAGHYFSSSWKKR